MACHAVPQEPALYPLALSPHALQATSTLQDSVSQASKGVRPSSLT